MMIKFWAGPKALNKKIYRIIPTYSRSLSDLQITVPVAKFPITKGDRELCGLVL